MAARERFLKEFPKAVADDAAAIFVGAGVSIGAGYPSWKALLQDIGVHSSDVLDLAALAQWSISRSAGKTRILTVIRNEVGVDKPVPIPLEVIARLPIRNIWTTSYDRLIERASARSAVPLIVFRQAATWRSGLGRARLDCTRCTDRSIASTILSFQRMTMNFIAAREARSYRFSRRT
jgi:hypothetical protein